MKYGYFDAKTREYVITRPDTPTPWINYLGSDEYCALVSNTGGGYSFHKDPKERRILRFRYNNLPADRPGRYLYIRDNDKKEFWSATWNPVQTDLKKYKYECRHGMSYTKISSAYSGISTGLTYFVPLNENLEVWALKVKNNSNKARSLSIFSYVEFCMWQAVMDMQDFQYTLNIAKAKCEDNTLYHLTGYSPKVGRNLFAYFASSKKISGFDTDRERFIGRCRSEANPEAVECGKSFNSVAAGGNPCGSHNIKLNLKKGEEKDIIFVLGISENMQEAGGYVKKYSQLKNVELELKKLKEYWEEYLVKFSAETPDKETDLMANTWNQYQCRTTFNWSRSASFYESGIGRGMGFRDSNQDVLGALHAIPEKVKSRLKDLAVNQFQNGSAHHQYFPLTKKGERGGYSDDPLWLVLSITAYVKETGDMAFLNEEVPFVEGTKATIYEHICRAVDYVFSQKGPHGLPLIGFADWNDCLNLVGPNKQAESVWVAQFLCAMAKTLSEAACVYGKKEDVKKYNDIADEVARRVNEIAWDGDWYMRAFDDDKNPVGSDKCSEGKIYLNTQSWAVLGGVADSARAIRCMDMVRKHLACEHGLMLVAPPYTSYDPKIGAMGMFSPGLKENGGVFCHSNPWAMIAEALLGRGEYAHEYYKKIAPVTRAKIADIHKTEPYIYSQFIAGTSHPAAGGARNSWLTGTASWNFVAISNYILGIRADYKGLIIDPCIPKKWNGFKVRRLFRNSIYEIDVKNPEHVNKGVNSVNVDGKAYNCNIIPAFNDGKTHKVEVVMGKGNALKSDKCCAKEAALAK